LCKRGLQLRQLHGLLQQALYGVPLFGCEPQPHPVKLKHAFTAFPHDGWFLAGLEVSTAPTTPWREVRDHFREFSNDGFPAWQVVVRRKAMVLASARAS
jgi:hypothetical protein